MSDPVVEALGGYLSNVDFTHFCTFTTKYPISLEATRHIAEKVQRFVHAGRSSTMFWAAEQFDVREGFHFHALLQTNLLPTDIWAWYFPRYGRCHVIDNREPDLRQSAAYYCAKYITKGLSDYDIYFADSIRDRAQLELYKSLNEFDRFPGDIPKGKGEF